MTGYYDDPVSATKADPNRSMREDELVAEVERLRLLVRDAFETGLLTIVSEKFGPRGDEWERSGFPEQLSKA